MRNQTSERGNGQGPEEYAQQGNTQEKVKDFVKNRLLEATVFLALLTAAAYLWGYLYQQGATSYFHVPSYMIEVSTGTIVEAFAESIIPFLGIAVLLTAAAYVYEFWQKARPGLVVVFGLAAFLVNWLYGEKDAVSVFTVVLFIVFAAGLAFASRPPINTALAASPAVYKEMARLSLFLKLAVSLLLLYGLSLAAAAIGEQSVKSENDFLTIYQDASTYIILDDQNLYYLVTEVNVRNNTFGSSYKLVSKKKLEENNLPMKYMTFDNLQYAP